MMAPLAPSRAEPAGRRSVGRGLQPSEHRAVLVAGDLIAAVAAVAVAIWLWTLTSGLDYVTALRSRVLWFLAVPLWLAALAPARHTRVALSLAQTVGWFLRVVAALLAAYVVVYFYAPRQALPRLLALYFLWEAALLTLAWRLVYVWGFRRAALVRRAVIVGTDAGAQRIYETIREQGGPDVEVIGFVAPHGVASADPTAWPVPVLGTGADLTRLVDELRIAEVVLAVGDLRGPLLDELLACQQAGLDIVPMATVYEQLLRRLPVAHLEPDWPFRSFAEAVRAKDASRLAKRFADLVGGAFGTALFLAALPLVALLIWLDAGRPIFYAQIRVGRGGRPFRLVKFRTMVHDAEREGAQWARGRDPRVTRVGRILRRARLDELPNFLAVLSGEMSLVGPRPERPEFVAELERAIPFYRARLIVAPGLTGWAQINYPYGDSIDDAAVKLEYDLYYLKHRSLLFDASILARTIGTVLRFRGR